MGIQLRNEYYIEDIVKITKASDKTVRGWVKAGLIEGERVGRRWIFTFGHIYDFLLNPASLYSLSAIRRSILNEYERLRSDNAPKKLVLLDIPNTEEEFVHAVIDAAISVNTVYGCGASVMVEENILRVVYYYDGAKAAFGDAEIKESQRMRALLEYIEKMK